MNGQTTGTFSSWQWGGGCGHHDGINIYRLGQVPARNVLGGPKIAMNASI